MSPPVTASRPELVVVACGLTRHQRGYVSDGVCWNARCRFVDSFDAMDRELPTLTQVDAVVFAPQDARGRSALETVQRMARDWPGTAIVMFLPAQSLGADTIRSLVLAGAHEVVFEGMHDTASLLSRAIETARHECRAETVWTRLQDLIPDQLHSMARAVLGRPDELTTVTEVAAALGVHRKTLVNRCARSGYLAPAPVILWCRLAIVGHMLERTGSTVESIGLALGFPSHTALRNQVKRYTGRTATAIRQEGGLAAVLAAWRRKLASRGVRLPIP